MRAHTDVIAEIEQQEEGPGIAALFDFDGTIIAGYSANAMFREQIRRGDLKPADLVEIAGEMLRYGMGNSSFSAMMMVSAQYMGGVEEQYYQELGQQLYDQQIARWVYPEARALIEAHRRKGHTIAMVTSATRYQVEAAAKDLGIDHVLCSELRVEDGCFTGELISPACFGPGKVSASESLAAEYDIDLSKSFFYSDSDDDLELLERVGKPRPLNPNKKLTAIAEQRGWPCQRFTSRGRPSGGQMIRSVAVLGSMASSVLMGLPVKALTGSERQAQNFSKTLFAETASALIGMDFDIRGEENLWAHRPAVFLFNHQSKADFIILAKLLRRDFSGVARRHEKGLPIFEKAMEMGGVVLIDRGNTRNSIESMKPLVESLKAGDSSVAIAPEGTRSIGTRLGSFKKGAFHLAMQAKVPLIPIVIHNANDIAPRGDFVYRSGTVCIDVLPPIETAEWQRKDLDKNIEEVRQQFLDTLGQR